MSAVKVDVLKALDESRHILEVADGVSPIPRFLADHDKARAAVAELIEAANEAAGFVFTRDIDADTWMACPNAVADAVNRLCDSRDKLAAALKAAQA